MLLGLSIGGPWGLGGHVPPPQFYWLNFGGARDPPPKKKKLGHGPPMGLSYTLHKR